MSSATAGTTSSTGLSELTLCVQRPGAPDQEVFVQQGVTIGRDQENTIRIDEPAVQRLHARVIRQPDGSFELVCESPEARLTLSTGQAVSELRLAPLRVFRIGTATISCKRHGVRAVIVATEHLWRVACPRCREPLGETDEDGVPAAPSVLDCPPQANRRCENCGLEIFHHDGGQAGFTGWLPGQVGPYRISRFVGKGGMGLVLQGSRVGTEEKAAIKLLNMPLADENSRRRFAGEIEALRSLDHPNIVRYRDSGHDSELAWLAMEWIEGLTLAQQLGQRLAEDRAWSSEEVSKTVGQICSGLQYLHAQGIVHRDLKPANVLVDRAGCVKLVDFGIVKRVAPDSVATVTAAATQGVGTPEYMAPEQVQGRDVGPASDIYALGVLWHELTFGVRPGAGPIDRQTGPCTSQWALLMDECLEADPLQRPSLKRIVEVLEVTAAIDEKKLVAETERTMRWRIHRTPAVLFVGVVVPSVSRIFDGPGWVFGWCVAVITAVAVWWIRRLRGWRALLKRACDGDDAACLDVADYLCSAESAATLGEVPISGLWRTLGSGATRPVPGDIGSSVPQHRASQLVGAGLCVFAGVYLAPNILWALWSARSTIFSGPSAGATASRIGYTQRLRAFIAQKSISLEYSSTIGTALGLSSGGRIIIRTGLTPGEEFGVLAHEVAHELLHRGAGDHGGKTVVETEAEAVAFVVGQAIGLDCQRASADYIALYRGDPKTLMQSLQRIQRTASTIIEAIQGGSKQGAEADLPVAPAVAA